jgi:hypothetical protein
MDEGADHRPALIGTRGKRIGVDALEVKMTAEACIVVPTPLIAVPVG